MKTEYEKCLAGEPFIGSKDPKITETILRTRRLLAQFNATDYADTKRKQALLREMFGCMGKGVHVDIDFHCEYGKHIFIGDKVIINMNCTFVDNNRIEIGSNVLIASNVQIYTATHSTKVNERMVQDWSEGEEICRIYALPVRIEDGVWIGGGAILLPGVTIGRNSVIGAGSVVTRSIPANCVAVGNPCRVIKQIDNEIRLLPTMRKYKHIIFDIDGTLIDTEEAILQSLKDTVWEMLHKDIEKRELKFALGIPGSVTLRKLGITDAERANDRWNEHLMKYKSQIRLFDGIPQLLDNLKINGYKLGIVTSKTRNEYTTDFAAPFALSDYFCIVICAEDAPRPKPSPEPLLAYLNASNINTDDAIYIGDTIYDSLCAQNAGLDFGLSAWGNAATQGISADYIFKSPADVLSFTARK